jgi:ribosomal protein L16 Arg81 hydroxylase
MSDHTLSLADLLGPIDQQEFFGSYWEQRPLVIHRGQPDYYRSILTLDDLDRLLLAHEQRYPAVRLAKVGSSFAPSAFSEDISWGSGAFTGVIQTDRLLAEYRAGATIIVDALHRTWKPITLLCKRLEAELNHPTQVNIYLTPASAQGFGQHYDTHDAFILQIAGHKHWRIYQEPLRLPLGSQPWDPERYEVGELIEEVDLQPGDLIYIPRGFVHEAMTSDTQSLHVTLGISTYTWMDVFAEALNRCRADVRFRESLPLRFASLDGRVTAAQSRFEALARALAEVASVEELFGELDRRFVNSRRPLLDGQIAAGDRLEQLTLESIVRRPDHLVFRLDQDEAAARLRFSGKELRFPPFVLPALRYLAANQQFAVSSLPDELDETSKLVLVRRLAREGFLWPSDA